MTEQHSSGVNVVGAEALNLIAEVGQEINASLDLDEVLAKIAAFVKRVIDYEIFAILLVDDTHNDLYFRFAIGHRPEVVKNWRVPLGQGITGSAAATRKAIRLADVGADPRYINALDSVRSELAVPLLFRSRRCSPCSPRAWLSRSKTRASLSAPDARPTPSCCSTKSLARRASCSICRRCCGAPPSWSSA
jgi:putative methionine-R-sulfoxide reductase with GAF domain